MFRKFFKFLVVCLAFTVFGCEEKPTSIEVQSGYNVSRQPLVATDFKVPVPTGYDWMITQSWAEHCTNCNSKGYDKLSTFGDYCSLLHATTNSCKYSWDFNLPGINDVGVSALASADGVVHKVQVKNADGIYPGKDWGNTVVIDHGNNVCSRYAHLKDDSVTVSEGQDVCQGFKIGEIDGTPKWAPHLHFQFEKCDTKEPIPMGFTDGNGIPQCIMGNDLYTNGVYTALKLTNVEKTSCDVKVVQKDSCKMGCPFNPACENKGKMPFKDLAEGDTTKSAVQYLWSECVVSGKSDGKFHENDKLVRAEALKMALVLFGLYKGCEGVKSPFSDVKSSDWFYLYVTCGLKYGIISSQATAFKPDAQVLFGEAAKMVVETAVKAGKISIKTGTYEKFPKMQDKTHWSYKYLQTLAYYGAVDLGLLNKSPSDPVSRGEYARMLAPLSPCYCADKKCQSGCECNEETYVCGDMTVIVTVKSAPDAKTGSSGGSGAADSGGKQDVVSFSASSGGCGDAGSSGNSAANVDVQVAVDVPMASPPCKPNCTGKVCGNDGCGGSCGTCSNEKFCASGKCEYTCTSTCGQFGCECGFCFFKQPGCEGSKFKCDDCPIGKACVNNKCEPIPPPCVPDCTGKECGADGCGGSCGPCLGVCSAGKCQTKWTCDPNKGYTIGIDAAYSAWESLTINGKYTSNTIPWYSMGTGLNFKCSELPVKILLTNYNVGQKCSIWLNDPSLPPFGIWWPHFEGLYADPGPNSGVYSTKFPFHAIPGSKLLIKIPYN